MPFLSVVEDTIISNSVMGCSKIKTGTRPCVKNKVVPALGPDISVCSYLSDDCFIRVIYPCVTDLLESGSKLKNCTQRQLFYH